MNKILLVAFYFTTFTTLKIYYCNKIYTKQIDNINKKINEINKELNEMNYFFKINRIKFETKLYENTLNKEELIIHQNNIEKDIQESIRRYNMGLQGYSN